MATKNDTGRISYPGGVFHHDGEEEGLIRCVRKGRRRADPLRA
jgi:hypothetical protein